MDKCKKYFLPIVMGLMLTACGVTYESGGYVSSTEPLIQECNSRDFPAPERVGFVRGNDSTHFFEYDEIVVNDLWTQLAVFSAGGMIHRFQAPREFEVLRSEHGFDFVSDDRHFVNIAGIITDPPYLNVTHVYRDVLYYLEMGERVMVIVLDGWGWHMHHYFADTQPFLARQHRRIAHTVFPPFTPVAMSSIFTGQLPNVHGVHDRATRTMAATDAFETAYELGFSSTRVQGGVNIVATSERPILLPNLGHVFYTDRSVFDAAMARIDDTDFMFIHFNSIDDIAHTYGPYAPQVREAMALMDELVQELVYARGGVVIILGDHGQHFLGEPGRLGDHLWVSHEDIFVPYVVIREAVSQEHGFYIDGHFLDMEELRTLQEREFSATIRPGTEREEIRSYRGFALRDILEHVGIDAPEANIIIHSYDGFAAGISMSEALLENQAYIAIWQDGQYFVERDNYWAIAPFQLVMAQDIFAQRFARYIVEIVIE